MSMTRCWWCGEDPLYVAYHDEQWGVPVVDERELFELLCLEGFQAGLSWITILRKREAFRAAFDGFHIASVAAYGDAEVARLVADAGIVRHEGKIAATMANARAVEAMHGAGRTLAELVWSHAPPARPAPLRRRSEVPAATPASMALAQALKQEGMRFVGPTTVYAFMQSAGLVNDHLAECFRSG
ncbi:MAG: DNA-3-methyladenine glycosylase I [Acidimicrobiia bacterium]|nr:DNA-3-methyladenine glycosylase I [Acidimicrobiia bacterium]